jgi:predicted nucleotidyltransferase component of viral defense system
MIPKAQILAVATDRKLQPTTVEKDYVLGWLLRSISEHSVLSRWVFKGGTALKKCFFETYRFSEDLDFTVPKDLGLSVDGVRQQLTEVVDWIEARSGLRFPRADWKIEEYPNPRGNPSFQAKVDFTGPLGLPRSKMQRVKFDLTDDELIADTPLPRSLHHEYDDAAEPSPKVLCYSVQEILAEKTRALVERHGRARDVYDLVHIARNFRETINQDLARSVAQQKFAFKKLPPPTVDGIIAGIDRDVLAANWEQQLAHQVPSLPAVDGFLDELRESIAWWLEPALAAPALPPVPASKGDAVPRVFFPSRRWNERGSSLDVIRYAARNRLLVAFTYKGAQRLVEPYSIRRPATGSVLLHAWEVTKNGVSTNDHRSYDLAGIVAATADRKTFTPRWIVEL